MKSVDTAALPGHAAIVGVIGRIPRGAVASYGEIAERAGLPRRARLVGRILRLTELDLPWHRVVRADGRPAFPPGSAQHRRQLRLLAAEGVVAVGGRIDLRRHGWQRDTDLDAAIWGPPRVRGRRAAQ
jgi:methylated-DNA-protein-cysteine methyltransferase-like protein